MLPRRGAFKCIHVCFAVVQELDYLQKQVDQKQFQGKLPYVTQYEALPESEQEGNRHMPWQPSPHRDQADPELAAVLHKVRTHICKREPL